jgi:nucleoid DNA-binding protein
MFDASFVEIGSFSNFAQKTRNGRKGSIPKKSIFGRFSEKI